MSGSNNAMKFRLSEVRRAVLGVKLAGLSVTHVSIDNEGQINLTIVDPDITASPDCNKGATPWDKLLEEK